jgi:hypothetical protein
VINTVIDKIKLCIDKVLPLISTICDRIGLVEMIDGQWEKHKMKGY